MRPGRLLISQTQIQSRVRQLGRTLTRHYRGERPLFLGIMNGALCFLADLLRAVELDSEVSCVRLASYTGTESTGKLRGLEAMGDSFKDRHVIIVDDIFDTGHTLAGVIQRLRELGAADVKVCVPAAKEEGPAPGESRLDRLSHPERIRRRLRARLQRQVSRPEADSGTLSRQADFRSGIDRAENRA